MVQNSSVAIISLENVLLSENRRGRMMGGRKEKGTDYRKLEKKNTDTSFDIFERL